MHWGNMIDCDRMVMALCESAPSNSLTNTMRTTHLRSHLGASNEPDAEAMELVSLKLTLRTWARQLASRDIDEPRAGTCLCQVVC